MTFRRCLLLASTLLPSLLLACGDDDPQDVAADATPSEDDAAPPDAAPISASCLEADEHSDLDWIQENIFNTGCSGFTACHQGDAKMAGGLNLESGMSEAALVDIDSTLFGDWKLVVPGDPENSYLMVILGSVEGPLDEQVGTMPYNNPLLCGQKIGALNRWITGLNE